MKTIEVIREACCSADDQSNPLTLVIEVFDSESLESLMARIIQERFLQFSSSHSTIAGIACGAPIVRVHAGLFATRTEFLIAPHTSAMTCLPSNRLEFMWLAPDTSFKPRRHGSSSVIQAPSGTGDLMASGKEYWFATRTYGWGWGFPTAWQGWVVYAVAAASLVAGFFMFSPVARPVAFQIHTSCVLLSLVVVCWRKGEPPRWRWGK